MPNLTFVLDGRDALSRVMDRAGDSADRLGRRLLVASINGDMAMRRLGNSTTARMAAMQRDTDLGAKATEALKGTLISLAPAAIPAAASLAPLAAGAGAVAVASIAFTAALVPQISALTDASAAQKAYEDAVEKSGARSEAAITAQVAYQRTMADLPPETRKAAVALGILKDSYKDWSDGLAGDTMPVFTKGLAVANALLPKTEGLVKGTSVELNRMMTVLGGGMESPGLDKLNSKFTTFANTTLRHVDDELVHVMRTTDGGKVGGGFSEFMTFAQTQGPVVASTLRNVATALIHVISAGSDVGVGMLDAINAVSGIVSAIPPDAIATVLQLVLALKLAKLAAVGMAAGRTAVAAFATSIIAMQAAAAAAPGRISGVTAAIGTLSRGAKIAMAGTGIGLLLIALTELSSHSKAAPPDVDKLTSSLREFAQSGKVSGEAARAFGTDLSGLADSLQKIDDPKGLDKVQQSIISFFGTDSTPVKDAKEAIDAVDKALASLVSNGQADLAAAALDRVVKKMGEQGFSAAAVRGKLDDYQSALADQAFEQQLAAQSMGLFGAQAQQVKAKLDAQKASADGLRQSIQALNDVNRAGLGGMIAFEGAIDAAAKAARDNAGALSMSHGQLNLNSEKARTAATALSDLAAKTDAATASARESGASWSTVNGIYARGREKLISAADAMGLTRSQARALADQILKTPDKTARLKGNLEDLQGKLASAKAQLAKVPDSRRAAIRAQITDLQNKVAQARAALNSVHSKTVSVMVQYQASKMSPFQKAANGYASGGKPKPGELAWVGEEGPELMRFGSGGGTEIYSHGESMAMVSDAAKTGRDAGLGLRTGMAVSTGAINASGRAMGAAVLDGIRDELEIASPSKKTKALAADAGRGILIGLTGSKAKISATAADLVKDIWAAWKGSKSTKDSHLVAMVNQDNAKLQKLASQRDGLAARISAARKFASDITTNARQDAQLSNLGIADDQVTAGSIQQGLAQKLAKINTFARYVKLLAAKGLNHGLLQQILNMGPDQGYAYASALLGAGSSSLKSINSLQSQISSSTTALGLAGADAMYDSGAQAGKGFLAGLAAQQKAIDAQMLKIAKGMQKAIKKALGIKSPSRVMAQLGRYTTQGLAVGLTEALPHIDRAMGVVAGRVASGGLGVAMPAMSGARGGGAGTTVYITIPGLVVDPVGTGQQIVTLLKQYGRHTGTTVTIAGGG